ncbi:RNA ligase family protein [bacterium]|nr:RNA ligase family protein [bacterium]
MAKVVQKFLVDKSTQTLLNNDMYKFPKIKQFHQTIKSLMLQLSYDGDDEEGRPIYKTDVDYPTIVFEGREKHHGTNASVVFDNDGNMSCQSRERVISIGDDNAGFAQWAEDNKEIFVGEYNHLKNLHKNFDAVIIYGEWCGGSIQKGVALNQLGKMFIVFAAKMKRGEETHWLPISHIVSKDHNIYNSNMMPAYEVSVDLNNPQLSVNQMNEWVEEIDKVSPFCKEIFGVEGHGEGLVFTVKGTNDFNTSFKVKGASHTKSKIKKLAKVDLDKLKDIDDAVEQYCTEDRLRQGWKTIVKSQADESPSSIGDFVKWVTQDIWEEEGDAIEASGITNKQMNSATAKKAVKWFQNKLNEF